MAVKSNMCVVEAIQTQGPDIRVKRGISRAVRSSVKDSQAVSRNPIALKPPGSSLGSCLSHMLLKCTNILQMNATTGGAKAALKYIVFLPSNHLYIIRGCSSIALNVLLDTKLLS